MKSCRICGSSDQEKKFTLYGKHEIVECRNCGTRYMDPQLSDVEITELYSEQYYASWGISGNTENESSKKMKSETFGLRLDVARRFVKTGRALDVGCATGYYLEAAAGRGYEPYGVELSEYSANLASAKFGAEKIHHGTLETCPFSRSCFSLITMFDLLEHVRDPLETLRLACDFLIPGGIILVTTPDTSSLSHRLMKRRWSHYKKEHFYYFNYAALSYLAKAIGMKMPYTESSVKALNLNYLHTQFSVYPHWLLSPVVKALNSFLPERMRSKNFTVPTGEITVVFQKPVNLAD